MTELAARYAEIERQLQSGIAAHLAHGRVVGKPWGGSDIRSLAPEPVEHRWQRIVDALPDSPTERAEFARMLQRRSVRYGLRRLRAGHSYHWQRPLALVRRETATRLRELGHAGFAAVVQPAVQLELGL